MDEVEHDGRSACQNYVEPPIMTAERPPTRRTRSDEGWTSASSLSHGAFDDDAPRDRLGNARLFGASTSAAIPRYVADVNMHVPGSRSDSPTASEPEDESQGGHYTTVSPCKTPLGRDNGDDGDNDDATIRDEDVPQELKVKLIDHVDTPATEDLVAEQRQSKAAPLTAMSTDNLREEATEFVRKLDPYLRINELRLLNANSVWAGMCQEGILPDDSDVREALEALEQPINEALVQAIFDDAPRILLCSLHGRNDILVFFVPSSTAGKLFRQHVSHVSISLNLFEWGMHYRLTLVDVVGRGPWSRAGTSTTGNYSLSSKIEVADLSDWCSHWRLERFYTMDHRIPPGPGAIGFDPQRELPPIHAKATYVTNLESRQQYPPILMESRGRRRWSPLEPFEGAMALQRTYGTGTSWLVIGTGQQAVSIRSYPR